MIEYSSSVTISRPPSAVFPYLIEREKQALWSDIPMRPLTTGPFGPGTRIELSFGMGPIRTTIQLEFEQVEPDRLLKWRTISDGPIRWRGEYRLAAADEAGTAMSQAGTLTFHGPWRLLEPLVGSEIRQGEIKELDRLKAVVEAS